jgi:hypothetical protein
MDWINYKKETFDDIQDWKEKTVNYVKECMIKNNEFLAKAFWFKTEPRSHSFMFLDHFLESEEKKNVLSGLLYSMMEKFKPDGFIFASESWINFNANTDLNKTLKGQKGTEEKLIFNFETKTSNELIVFNIIRPTIKDRIKGKKLRLTRYHLPEGFQLKGRFVNIYNKKPKLPDN